MQFPGKLPNSFGHPHLTPTDVSELQKEMKRMQEIGSVLAKEYETYRPPQIDYAEIDRTRKMIEESARVGQEYATRFSTMLRESQKDWQRARETISSIVNSDDFRRATEQARQIAESVTENVLYTSKILEGFDVLQDRVIFKDIVIAEPIVLPTQQIDLGPVDLPLFSDEIVLEDVTLDPIVFDLPRRKEALTPVEAAPPSTHPLQQESPKAGMQAPTFFIQKFQPDDALEIFNQLPPGADLIDDVIALYEPRKAGILLLTQLGWIKKSKGVTGQTIRVVQYLRRIAKRPGEPHASLTELGRALAKRAASPRTARSSIHNRLNHLEQICFEHNCKPIVVKHGHFWKINTDLTHWDDVAVKPWVHL